jgi:glycosyltransferase involved in cell wall biosynthesis
MYDEKGVPDQVGEGCLATTPTPPPPLPLPMTVLIRTFNEEDRIERAIKSVHGLAEDILVIDSGSTDNTVALAERCGARVLFNPWPGFGPQRRFGEAHCRHDLIFSLDADEEVTPELAAEIRQTLSNPHPPRLLIVRKALIVPGRTKPAAFPFCHEQIYIYDRRIARTIHNPNWDRLEVAIDEQPHRLRAICLHFCFRDWSHAARKFTAVAELAASTMPPRSPRRLAVRLVYEFPLNFLKFFLLRRYFLAGIPGFILAVVTAYGRFIRIAMMYEKTAVKNARRKSTSLCLLAVVLVGLMISGQPVFVAPVASIAKGAAVDVVNSRPSLSMQSPYA